MTKLRLILLLCFVLVFLAGGSVGLLVRQKPAPLPVQPKKSGVPRGPTRPLPWQISQQKLNLTDAQRSQMQAIWADCRGVFPTSQCDRDIHALLGDERYHAVVSIIRRASEMQPTERRRLFEAAEIRMQALLTPEQLAIYKEEKERRRKERERHYHWSTSRPAGATRPAFEPGFRHRGGQAPAPASPISPP